MDGFIWLALIFTTGILLVGQIGHAAKTKFILQQLENERVLMRKQMQVFATISAYAVANGNLTPDEVSKMAKDAFELPKSNTESNSNTDD